MNNKYSNEVILLLLTLCGYKYKTGNNTIKLSYLEKIFYYMGDDLNNILNHKALKNVLKIYNDSLMILMDNSVYIKYMKDLEKGKVDTILYDDVEDKIRYLDCLEKGKEFIKYKRITDSHQFMNYFIYILQSKGIYEINYDKFCELTGFPNKEMFNFYLNNVFLPIKNGELRFSFQEEKLKKTINDVEMFFMTRKNKVTYDLPKLSYKDGIYYTNNYKENLEPLYKDDYDKLLEVTENYLNSLVKLNR